MQTWLNLFPDVAALLFRTLFSQKPERTTNLDHQRQKQCQFLFLIHQRKTRITSCLKIKFDFSDKSDITGIFR